MLVSQTLKGALQINGSISKTLRKRTKRSYAAQPVKEERKTQVLVIGGGTAGIGVSSILSKTNDVLIVDPSDNHYYQPGWTLVGGGLFKPENTERAMSSVVPKGANFLKDAVVSFDPENNSVETTGGVKINYDYLFVCSGLQINWGDIKGLEKALEDPNSRVCSNYSFQTAQKTWKNVQSFKRGKAIFTHPAGVIKCGGAPQKVMYLSDDIWKNEKKKADVHFYIGGPFIFAAVPYREPLLNLISKKGINPPHFNQDLVEVDSENFIATFKNVQTQELTTEKYSFLHVTPKMGAPSFLKGSPIANADGYVDVNINTLQHKKYPNIFSVGDSAALPTSKTAAAISSQIPVAVKNFLSYKTGVDMNQSYDGYTACPITTGEGKVMMAEFNYDPTKKQETFPMDSTKPSSFNFLLKTKVFPAMYWNGILTGRWRGPGSLPHKKYLKN